MKKLQKQLEDKKKQFDKRFHKKTEKKKEKGTKKPDWLGKRPPESELSKSKSWMGKDWYYFHKDTGGKFEGIWR